MTTTISKELQEYYESYHIDITPFLRREETTSTGIPAAGVAVGVAAAAVPPVFRYRFVRLNPRFDGEDTLRLLQEELNPNATTTTTTTRTEEEEEDVHPTTAAAISTNTTTIDTTTYNAAAAPASTNDEDYTRAPILVPWVGVEWQFYAIPSDFSLASSPCFRTGRIYGMDVSSGAGLAALFSTTLMTTHRHRQRNETGAGPGEEDDDDEDPEEDPDDNDSSLDVSNVRILDLCCCPGLKLCAIADYWKHTPTSRLKARRQKRRQRRRHHSNPQQPKSRTMDAHPDRSISATIVGVDISPHRMEVCKKIVTKYHIDLETSAASSSSSSSSSCTITAQQMNHNKKHKKNNSVYSATATANADNGDDTTNTNTNNNVVIQLYCQDGTQFGFMDDYEGTNKHDEESKHNNNNNSTRRRRMPHNLVFDSRVAQEEVEARQTRGRKKNPQHKRKRMNKSARARERKHLHQLAWQDWVRPHEEDADVNDEDENDEKRYQKQQQQQQQQQGIDSVDDEDRKSTSGIEKDPIHTDDTDQKTVAEKQGVVASHKLRIKPFDYVLVDAECSTDGSLKHMRERLKAAAAAVDRARSVTDQNGEQVPVAVQAQPHEESNPLLTDTQQLTELVALQKRLLGSGFRLLKPGGTLVYSTCSFSVQQNEDVVRWLLTEHPSQAVLIPVEFPVPSSSSRNPFIVAGKLEGTVRLYPTLLHHPMHPLQEDEKKTVDASVGLYGDGFFIAKIRKKKNEN